MKSKGGPSVTEADFLKNHASHSPLSGIPNPLLQQKEANPTLLPPVGTSRTHMDCIISKLLWKERSKSFYKLSLSLPTPKPLRLSLELRQS